MATALQTAIADYRATRAIPDRFFADNLLEVRIAPLAYGELLPPVAQITPTGSTISEPPTQTVTGSTTVEGESNVAITLYAGQSLNFGNGIDQVVTVAETITLVANTPATITIMPYQGTTAIDSNSNNAQIYITTPLWSIDSGGVPDPQLTHATSENRQQARRVYHEIIRTTDQVSMSGALNMNDPSFDVMMDAFYNRVFDVYVEATAPWYVNTDRNGVTYPAGQGGLSCKYSAPAKIAPQVEKDGLARIMIEGPVNNKEEWFLLPSIAP